MEAIACGWLASAKSEHEAYLDVGEPTVRPAGAPYGAPLSMSPMHENTMRDDMPYDPGYRESRRKLGLHYKPGRRCRAYPNHRNAGGMSVAE